MYQLLLLLTAYCSSSSGRAAQHYIPWKNNDDISNLQLLHPVVPTVPDESYSNIPSEAFTLDSEMTKRTLKLQQDLNKKMSGLNGRLVSSVDLSNLLQQAGDDMYIIMVKKHDDNDDVTASEEQSASEERQQSSEYYRPADTTVHHVPHYYGASLLTDEPKPRATDDTRIPLYKKEASHSIYLNKDVNLLNNFAPTHNLNRVIPKVFPSKFMMNPNIIENKPEPLVVYVNKDIEHANGLRSHYKPQEEDPLPMTVYVDKNDNRADKHDEQNTKTLEELIKEMHDSRYPKPIKVYITKEEPQQEEEIDADAKHMKHLMHQIRALNKMLHGDDAPEPYTMYVDNQVVSSEEISTEGGQQPSRDPLGHLATVGGDSEQSVVQAICSELGAAFCAGDLQISRREGERRPLDGRRRKARHHRERGRETDSQGKQEQWSVFNNNKDNSGQPPFVI